MYLTAALNSLEAVSNFIATEYPNIRNLSFYWNLFKYVIETIVSFFIMWMTKNLVNVNIPKLDFIASWFYNQQ